MKYYGLLITLLLVSFPGIAAPKVQKETFISHNKKRTYYLFVPDSVKQSAPLIVLLHGSGRDGLSLVDKWKDLANKEGIILAGPDAAGSAGWSTSADGPSVLRDLVEALKSKYPVNSRRVYLFGHSAGAVHAIDLALLESEYFAAMAIHAGGFRDKKEFDVISRARRKIPLAIWIGTQDQYFPLSSVRATRDALVAGGFTVEMTEMQGHDHWYYDLAPRINEAAWQFLKKYELPAEPHYEDYPDVGDTGGINEVIAEVNKLEAKVNDLTTEINIKDLSLNTRDLVKDRAEINKTAQDEVSLIKDAAGISREAAAKAEQAAGITRGDRYQQFLKLVSQQHEKYAEMLDAKREQVEMLLTSESLEVINARRSEIQKKIEKLQQEAEDLQKQAQKVLH